MAGSRVIFFASDTNDPLLEVAADYLRRTDRRVRPELLQLKPARRKKSDSDASAEADEAERLLAASEGCYRIVLDERAPLLTSVELSERMERWLQQGRSLAFLIGGATGLAPQVRESADQQLSLSRFTLPHRLAVLVLAEQLYRAGEIARGGPYHK